jgi:hypothetical protein
MGKARIALANLAARAGNLAALMDFAFCGAQYYVDEIGTPTTGIFVEARLALTQDLRQLASDIEEINAAERSQTSVA